MTTRTGTTRKAPWAVFLTALLAVLAVVLGSLVIAAPANAKNDPDKTPPGQSEQGPPGHQGDTTLPPGQQDDGTPGNSGGSTDDTNTPGMSHDKIRICHATASVNHPFTMPDVDMASIDEWGNADLNGHGDHAGALFTVTMVQGDHWGDIIPPFTYQYTVKEGKGQDKVEVTKTVTFAGLNWTTDGQKIYNNGCAPVAPCVDGVNGEYGGAAKLCKPTTPTPASLCDRTTMTVVSFPDNTAKEYTDALALTSRYTSAPCPTGGPTAGALCDLTMVPPTMVTFPDISAPDYVAALLDAQAATHTRYAAVCPLTEVADAAVAAAIPQPATVAAPSPAKVTVPAKGPVVPATVPAGDGSSVPTVPVTALALLVLGATALAASTVRLAGTKK